MTKQEIIAEMIDRQIRIDALKEEMQKHQDMLDYLQMELQKLEK